MGALVVETGFWGLLPKSMVQHTPKPYSTVIKAPILPPTSGISHVLWKGAWALSSESPDFSVAQGLGFGLKTRGLEELRLP